MTRLYLVNNGLVGPLPNEWAQQGCLSELELVNNHLNGTLPAKWGSMANLTSLWLSNNDLEGSLPPEWGDLYNLDYLVLRNNSLNGTLPFMQWSNMTALQYIDARDNCLTGSVPSSALFPQVLLLANNRLSGSLPADLSGVMLFESLQQSVERAFAGPLDRASPRSPRHQQERGAAQASARLLDVPPHVHAHPLAVCGWRAAKGERLGVLLEEAQLPR